MRITELNEKMINEKRWREEKLEKGQMLLLRTNKKNRKSELKYEKKKKWIEKLLETRLKKWVEKMKRKNWRKIIKQFVKIKSWYVHLIKKRTIKNQK